MEKGVGALGEESPHAKPLLVALKAARAKLNVPVSVQIESTAKYLERARKRLVQAEAKLAKVAAQKDEGVAEVDAARTQVGEVASFCTGADATRAHGGGVCCRAESTN